MIQSASSPNPTDRHAVVIGGGLAGLSSAVELLSAGLSVTLVEKNEHLGGKMNVLEDRGYRFDMGPTIITLPQVLRGIIRRAGRDERELIDLRPLDPQWRCLYEDQTTLDLRADVEVMARALDEQFPDYAPGAGYRRFIDYSRRMYNLSEKVFFFKDLGAMTDLMRSPPPREPGLLSDVLAMRLHSTVGVTAHRWIDEPHVQQLVEHFLQYVGSSPFLAPSILTLIASAQVDQGCWYPMGGTRMVARSLATILRESDRADVRTGVGVERIETTNDKAGAVVLDSGERIEADAVLSNCDVQRTYRNHLSHEPAALRALANIGRKYEPACSGVVLYLGLRRQYDHLAHHNFLFSGSSQQEFNDIYKRGEPARDPSIYLAAPSRTDPDQAPEGCEALYVLIHTPYKREHHAWLGKGGMMERYRPTVIDKLKTCGRMPDIEDHIEVEHHLTPDDIDRMYNAEGGAIYGLASHGRLKGGFKPRNRSRAFGRLYFAGGSANPGPGVPMVLMSGVTAARCVCEDLGLPTSDEHLSTVEDEASPLHELKRAAARTPEAVTG